MQPKLRSTDYAYVHWVDADMPRRDVQGGRLTDQPDAAREKGDQDSGARRAGAEVRRPGRDRRRAAAADQAGIGGSVTTPAFAGASKAAPVRGKGGGEASPPRNEAVPRVRLSDPNRRRSPLFESACARFLQNG